MGCANPVMKKNEKKQMKKTRFITLRFDNAKFSQGVRPRNTDLSVC